MEQVTGFLPVSGAVIAAMMIVLWCASLALRRVTFIDGFWGPGFLLVSAAAYLLERGYEPRAAAVLGLVVLWSVRLSWHIFSRGGASEEDFRYINMRRRYGKAFPLISLFIVFLFQGLIMWIVSLPLVFAIVSEAPAGITLTDIAGAAAALAGLLIEAVADRQLAAFKSDPANSGKPLDSGLWAWSRHPNYFGESLFWCGLFLIAASVPGGLVSVVSPALITFLLLRVSGIPLLEKKMKERPAYREYMEKTSVFIPLPPKR